MGSAEIVVVAMIGAVFAGSLILYLILKPGRAAVSIQVEPGIPFLLEAAPADSRDYKLWLKYDINWVGREHGSGLIFDLKVETDGASVFDGQLRMGGGAATEEDRERIRAQALTGKTLPPGLIMPTKVRCSRGRRGGMRYERATVALYRIRQRNPGSLITVRGTVTPAEGTEVNSLHLYLAK